ncbi:NADPH:quinone reductase [Sinomonas sp.]|uniref:NADPH:quinone reductase n=1 Tax=Sinomonas sp. TaxID=1914986 RepID=UPI003F811E3C
MKAIMYNRTGDSSVLELREKPLPEPAEGEVRVKVVVSGVNPTDWKARAGGTYGALDGWHVPNQDGAGVVDAVGPAGAGASAEGTGLEPGQRVWLWDVAHGSSEGTAQEYAVVPLHKVVPLPEGVPFDVGASVGIPALTAHRALTAHDGAPARLAPGTLGDQVILVTGGAGAVGHAAIQLAKWAGATVIATVSGDAKAELARKAGADVVVNYKSQDVADEVRRTAPDGVDLVVDVNAAANLEADLKALKTGGTIAIYAANSSDEKLTIPVRQCMAKNARLQFILTYTVTDEQKTAAISAVTAALADDALGVGEEHGLPLTRFRLEDTAQAHDAVQQGTVGKVLIDVGE